MWRGLKADLAGFVRHPNGLTGYGWDRKELIQSLQQNVGFIWCRHSSCARAIYSTYYDVILQLGHTDVIQEGSSALDPLYQPDRATIKSSFSSEGTS